MQQQLNLLNQKYEKLLGKITDYNTQFSDCFQSFYLLAHSAGQEDFQSGQQATNKLKKSLEQLYASAEKANQYIVENAYERYYHELISIPILISTLLKSHRWQDNNAGIQIIIIFLETKRKINLAQVSRIFKTKFTDYLEQSEEVFQENTAKLFALLINEDEVFSQEEYFEIQNTLITSITTSLTVIENSKSCLEQIQEFSLTHTNELIELNNQDSDYGFESKFTSSVLLSPYLVLLKEISQKTQQFNFKDLLLKCCFVNQRKAQTAAFDLISNMEEVYCEQITDLLQSCLYNNSIEIRKQALQLTKKLVLKLEDNEKENMVQKLELFIILNENLEPIKGETAELVKNHFITDNEKRKKMYRENFSLIANICSLQIRNQNIDIRRSSWRNLYVLITQSEHQQGIEQMVEEFVKLFKTFLAKESDSKTFYFLLYFIDSLISTLNQVKQIDKTSLIEFLSNFIQKFDSNQIQSKLVEIIIKLDNQEQFTNQIIQTLQKLTKQRVEQIVNSRDVSKFFVDNGRQQLYKAIQEQLYKQK